MIIKFTNKHRICRQERISTAPPSDYDVHKLGTFILFQYCAATNSNKKHALTRVVIIVAICNQLPQVRRLNGYPCQPRLMAFGFRRENPVSSTPCEARDGLPSVSDELTNLTTHERAQIPRATTPTQVAQSIVS